ncbi:hypothetical protein BYT27DRAFT_7235456 [Phlegmacium glaucopus]|nr:hypothetical protein BYT27DRAFT_7235456 [Phlegmacium glaucopus]
MSKVVFVGNVPYNMGEDQLIDVFKSVGQVIGFRLVFDRDTGKPKGYGFCEFADHETAASAVRNLNNTDVGGRPLRIDLADSDPFLEGKTTVRGELLDGGFPGPSEPRSQWRAPGGRAPETEAFLASLPSGIQVPKGSSVLDSISQTLASMAPNHLMEVLAQMKAFVITHPDHARILLVKLPQLAYALFQALLLNKIVDSAILERMLATSRAPGGAPLAGSSPAQSQIPPSARPPIPMPPHLQQQQQQPPSHYPPHMPPFPPTGLQHSPAMSANTPPASAMFSHQQQHISHHPPPAMPPISAQMYRPPPPPAQPQPTPVTIQSSNSMFSQPKQPAALPEISETQRAMLMQVLSLTPEQINGLAEPERAAINQLRNQFMGLGNT